MSVNQELIDKHAHLALHDANEAETRLKLIDRIIFEVLDWSHDDVTVEERVAEDGKSTYTDYIIRTAGTAFVIEAKKAGKSFVQVPNQRRVKLVGSIMEGETGEAIKQARDYCRKAGIPFAIVTNGAQWIIFPATRIDGVSFAQSSAIIFNSIQSLLHDHFTEFTTLLKREEVIAASLEIHLLGRQEDQFSRRLLRNYYTNRRTISGSNPIFPLIENEILIAFSETLADFEADMMQKCYVSTADRRKFDSRIQMYLSKPQRDYNKVPKRPMKKQESRALDDKIGMVQERSRPVAILVLGSVGSGKTTFLDYTRKVSSAEFFTESKAGPHAHWIYIDFRNFVPNENSVEFIYKNLYDYIVNSWFLSNFEQCIRPSYKVEIDALKNGPLKLLEGNEDKINEKLSEFLLEQQSDKKNYVDKILSYAASKAPIFLVIDNVDQIDREEAQNNIFAEGIAISHRNKLNLVMSLREATFAKHRTSAVFNAFDFDPLYIDPPPIMSVLSKRFFLLKEMLTGKAGNFISEGGAKVQVNDLSTVSNLIQSSVLGTRIGEVIDILATSDVRLALRMTREFLESGYSQPGKAIQVYEKTGKYTLPRHEALRSVLLGKEAVYREEFSIIGNPFDSRLSRTNSQLLRMFILNALVAMSTRASFQYLHGDQIKNSINAIGFADDFILHILNDLCKFRFVNTGTHSESVLTSSYYPTRLGGHIVRNLIADLTFLEAMVMDTFIADVAIWEELRNLSEEIVGAGSVVERLELRNQRVTVFYQYIGKLYSVLASEAQLRGLQAEWCGDPFTEMGATFNRNKTMALNSAKRNYQ